MDSSTIRLVQLGFVAVGQRAMARNVWSPVSTVKVYPLWLVLFMISWSLEMSSSSEA
jgi:hypothetical protein